MTDDALQAALAASSDGHGLALVLADVARAQQTRGRAPSTLAAYRGALQQVRSWCLQNGRAPDSLTDHDVALLTATALRGGPPFKRSVGISRARIIHAAIAHAYASRGMRSPVGDLSCSVLREAARTAPPARAKYAITSDEIRRCIRVALNSAPWWVPAVLAVGFGGALRAGELRCVASTLEHPAERRGGVVLLPVTGKSGPRLVRLVASANADYCPARWAMVCLGRELPSIRAIHAALRRVFVLAGIPAATPHSLRVGWATEAARRGVPISAIVHHLAHADARPTQRYTSVALLDSLPSLV